MGKWSFFLMLLVIFICGEVKSTEPMKKPLNQIIIGNETFSPTQSIPMTALVVKEERKKIEDDMNMMALYNGFHLISSFMRIAYNGIRAAGPHYTDLQIEIQHIGYNISSLCDETVLALGQFKRAASKVQDKRRAAYLFLYDGYEEMATESISSIKDIANNMEKVALDLVNGFARMKQDVIVVLDRTRTTKKEQDIRIRELKKERLEMEKTQEEQQKVADEANERRREAEAQVRYYKLQEDEAIRELSSKNRLFRDFVNYASNWAGMGDVFSSSEKVAKMFHDWYQEQKQTEEKERKLHLEALGRLRNAALRLSDIETIFQSEESIAGAVTEALHETVGALQKLSVVMSRAANFWKSLANVIDEMDYHLYTAGEAFKNLPKDTRLAVWNSYTVVEGLIRQSGMWMAVYSICDEYWAAMKIVQQKMYEYLEESPTYEESRVIIRNSATEFLNDVKQKEKEVLALKTNKYDELHEALLQLSENHNELQRSHEEL